MSASEYHDMYLACQKNKGKYFMVTIDLKDSSNYCGIPFKNFLKLLKKLKHIQNHFVKLGFLIKYNKNWEHILYLGDCIGILAKTGDINVDEFCKEVNDYAKKQLKVDYHFASGYCDTLEWVEGNQKYYAGYLFNELSIQHKNKGRLKWEKSN